LVSLASMRYAYSATADDFSNDVRFNPCSSVVGNANFDPLLKTIKVYPLLKAIRVYLLDPLDPFSA